MHRTSFFMVAASQRQEDKSCFPFAPRKSRSVAAKVRVGLDARCLSALGEEDEAANVIRKTLKKTYDRDMVMIFGRLAPRDDNSQLADVEAWIEKHGEQPELMLVAGRLCLARKLWGRARHYLDSEAAARVGPQAALELGRLQERLDDAEGARKSYRRGLEKAVYVT